MSRKITLTTIVLLLLASPAWAGVAALSYSDTAGQAQTVAPSKQYINPVGGIDLYLTAGLDRKVGYVLKDSAGQTVAQGVSGLITASDTITVLGQTYYGKVLSVPAALAEGNYTLTGQILTSGGSVVSSQNYALVVDRTGPQATGPWQWDSTYLAGEMQDYKLIAPYGFKKLTVANVSDVSGVATVKFESYDLTNGAVYASQPAWYDTAAQTIGINGTVYNFFPANLDGTIGIRFTITDVAGNSSTISRIVKYNGSNEPAPELIAVYNPNVTTELIPGSGLVGYEPYTPGMTLYANPMSLLYRVPKTNWITYNPDYGLSSKSSMTTLYTDANYVYLRLTVPYDPSGTLNANVHAFTSPGWWATHYITYNLVLAPSVSLSPVITKVEKYQEGLGWIKGGQTWHNQPDVISAIRVTAEPRNYVQYYKLGNGMQCAIPVGETSCTVTGLNVTASPGTIYRGQFNTYLWNEDNTLSSSVFYVQMFYDLIPPYITAYAIDKNKKTIVWQAVEPYTETLVLNGSSGMDSGWLVARNNQSGHEVQLNGALQRLSGDSYQLTVDYSSLPEGDYDLTLWVKDKWANTGSLPIGQLVLDQTPPAVGFYREGVALSGHEAVDSLGKLSFTVTDGVDPAPVVESVRLTGGPQQTDVYLAYRQENGAYWLEYPVLYPSQGQEYSLAVTVKDANGNRRTQTLAFSYEPPRIQLSSAGAETLNLPAIPAAVVHADGSNALLSQPVQIGGQAVSGTYDLVVLSASDSTVPVAVNGLLVMPGEQKAISGYDFGAKGGRLDLPVWSDQPGRANILVTSLAPNFPVLAASINFWRPQVQLSAAPGWAVQPLVQAQKISFAPGEGTPCRLVFEETQARSADPVSDPACLVEIVAKPSGYQLRDGQLQGYLKPDGPFAVAYQVSVYNNGAKYVLGTGSQDLALLPLTDVAVSVAAPAPPLYQKVQEVSLAAQSAGRIPCRVTADQEEALRLGAYEPVCLVRWQAVPAGLNADGSLPVLRGRLDNAGVQAVSWSVDVYAPAGQAAGAATGSLEITAVEPPEPVFTLQPGLYAQAVDDANLVVMAEGGGDVGSVQFRPPIDHAGMTLTVEVDGAAESYVYQPVRAITFARYLKLGPLPVWTTKDLRVSLSYTHLPEKRVEKSYRVTVAPLKRLEAWLTADRAGSSTTGLGVSLQVGSRSREGISYNRAEHGDWEVEFGYIEGVNDYHAMTTKEPVPESGVLAKTLHPPLGNVKLVAVLSLKPPAAASFYSRTLLSNKAYAQVLKGEAPAGEISSTVASGPAPLVVTPKLKVSSEDQRVMGKITWQLSRDNGANWEDLSGVQPYMAQLKLDPGQYVVRVELENKFSRAKGYTNQLAFTVYDVPEVVVSGPNAVIVNTPMTLQAALASKGQAVAADDAVIQWYRHDRQGDVLVETGPSYTVTPSEMGNYQYIVKASLKSAVATDAKAWRQSVKFVRVVPPAPPEIRLIAPNSMEYNTKEAQTYQLQAAVSLRNGLDLGAYPVEGEWELPDGTKVSGQAVSYSPTAADAAQRKSVVAYRAWIRGMKDSTTATVVKSIPLTIYDWPAFSITVDQDYAMAPSLVTLTAMPATGKPWTLEKPQYSWKLPEGANIVRTLDNGRIVQAVFNQTGSQAVSVDVQDARGSTATATAAVELAEAPPFTVSFQPLYSNPDKREPLDVLVRARFSGGHPADRIVSVAYATEAPGAAVNQSLGYVQGLPAGDQAITVTATTKFGQTVTGKLAVTVEANQPPSCTLSSRRDARYVYLEAACSDPDGKIAAYRWYRNGRVVGCSNRLTQSLADAAQAVSFEAIDNNGAKYQETISPQ